MHRSIRFPSVAAAPRTIAFALSLLSCALLLSAAPARAQQSDRSFKAKVVERHRSAPASVSAPHLAGVGASFQRWQASNDVLARRAELRAVRGITTDQILAYDALAASVPGFVVKWDESNTVPILLEGAPLCGRGANATAGSERDAISGFFATYGALLRITDGAREFRVTERSTTEDGRTHLRLAQTHDGIAVWAAQIVLELSARGEVLLFMGRYMPTPATAAAMFPKMSGEEALAIFTKSVGRPASQPAGGVTLLAAPALPSAVRVWYVATPRATPRAAYAVEYAPGIIDRWQGVVDAATGDVLKRFNAVCSDGPQKATASDLNGASRSIDTYLKSGVYYMIDAARPMYDAASSTIPNNPVGAIITLSSRNTDLTNVVFAASIDNTWSDRSTVSAHANAALTYEYFRTTHGRSGIDGNGGTIISIVNATQGGVPMDNAYWNGRFMVYGNGDQFFKPLAGGLDVGAHEMTHGVTEHSAGLQYLNQSGALNEAFSDMFAAMVDRKNWTLGEEIVKAGATFPTGAMRDMADPHNGGTQGSASWQPNHMREYQNLSEAQDNGGVHINSGIPNHAAYLLATAITREKAEKILYRALTTKLTTQSQFIDFRLAIVRSAEELYGASSAEATACKNACDQVGITDGTGTKNPPDLPPVNGDDRMLFVSTDVTDPVFLWTVKPPANANDYSSISSTMVFTRPCVSDDGSIAVFIDAQGWLRGVTLNPAAPNEQIIDTSAVWGSVALSRDKRVLALTTFAAQPNIYVFDLQGPVVTGNAFEIYAPTYSGGKQPDVAQFADAMDFSSDGSALLFDVYNEVTVDGNKVGFWEINLMDVWNPAKGTFGTGTIFRLFPQEPGIDLGNPHFARNKQTLFTFDAMDSKSREGYILSSDYLLDKAMVVAQVPYNSPGYPSYRGDDRMISFASNPLHGGGGVDSIYNVAIEADGLTALNEPVGFVPWGIYPIWYRNGVRPTGVEFMPAAIPGTVQLEQNYPNPFNPSTTIRFRLPEATSLRLTVHDAMGRTVRTLWRATAEAGSHSVVWDGRDERGSTCPSGVYVCRLATPTVSISKTMIMVK